jgi:hypothetical protein
MEPLQPHQLLSLVDELGQAAVEEASSCRSPQSHSRLLSLIDQLRLAVETPTETVLRLIYQVRDATLPLMSIANRSQPPQNAALRTAIDLGVFDHLVSRGRKGLSATELSTHTNAERGLIGKCQSQCIRSKLMDGRSTLDASCHGIGSLFQPGAGSLSA